MDLILLWFFMWSWVWHQHSLGFTSGATFEFSFPIETSATNNQAEYLAILKGIQLLKEIKADAVEIFGDSMLVIN